MSSTEDSTQGENADVVPSNATFVDLSLQLSTFTKYSVLVPELRKPVLEYSTLETLKKYAECSKLCSSEVASVQKTIAPGILEILETREGVTVRFIYKRTDVRKIFPHGCTTNRDVEDYVLKTYRTVNRGNTDSIYFNVKQWPERMMEIKQLASVYQLQIHLYKPILNDFMQLVQTSELSVYNLVLYGVGHGDNEVVIPREFFKTNLVKNVRMLHMHAKCQIDREDFINTTFGVLYLKNWFNIEWIHAKLFRLIETNNADCFRMIFDYSVNDSDETHLDMLFPSHLFPAKKQIFCDLVEISPSIRAKISLRMNITELVIFSYGSVYSVV